jgi:ADP-heptose:LPS heptosyltransferase
MAALVICTGGGLGDVLLATPVMRALRASFGEVVALTSVAHREVLVDDPDLAEVWTDDVPFARQIARIRRRGFAASVTTWATLRSASLPFFAGIPLRAGQARRTYSGLFSERVVVRSENGDRTTHWADILLDYARALGADTVDTAPVFVVPAHARLSVAASLAARGVTGEYVVLHPTRGITAARDRWPVERLGDLARALSYAEGVPVVVTGAGADRDIADAIAARSNTVSLGGGTTIAEFGALAAGARAVVALDSGPMHVAAAVGARTVGIFALRSDEPDRWAPRGPRTAVVRPDYPCPPAHRKETCPDFACIAALDIERVLAAVRGLP